MKVFIVEEYVLHEGGAVLGVYSSEEKAEEFVAKQKELSWKWYEVTEWEVENYEQNKMPQPTVPLDNLCNGLNFEKK